MVAEIAAEIWYVYGLPERCRIMADAGFVRDHLRIWRHADGRAIGEGVMMALIDSAFLRFLRIDPSSLAPKREKPKRKTSAIKRSRRAK